MENLKEKLNDYNILNLGKNFLFMIIFSSSLCCFDMFKFNSYSNY